MIRKSKILKLFKKETFKNQYNKTKLVTFINQIKINRMIRNKIYTPYKKFGVHYSNILFHMKNILY